MKTTHKLALHGSAILAAGAMIAGLLSPGTATATTPSLPLLATGTVVFPDGVSTAQVLAFATPNQATLKKTATGDTLNVGLVSSTNVTGDGSFTLTLDPAQVPGNAVMPDRSINMEVIAVSGGLQQVYFFPVKLAQTADGAAFVSTTTSSKPATPNLSFDVRGGAATNVKYDASKWLSDSGRPLSAATLATLSANATRPVTATTAEIAAAVAADTTPKAICLLHPGDYIKGRPEHFVNVYTDAHQTSVAHVTQSANATHTLGVAVAFGGSWHQSGTANISRGASVSVTSADRQKAWSYWNKVNYRKFFDSCVGAYQKPAGFYDLIAGDLDGPVGMIWLSASCGVKVKGDEWDTGSAQAATFGTGVDLPVVDVSAQTGFGTSENVHFTFLRKGEIAGNVDSGPVSSSKVEVDKFYGDCRR